MYEAAKSGKLTIITRVEFSPVRVCIRLYRGYRYRSVKGSVAYVAPTKLRSVRWAAVILRTLLATLSENISSRFLSVYD